MSIKGMIKVSCIQCLKCKDIIYSRALHDYHACSCGDVTIDGGFSYVHIGWTATYPTTLKKYVRATRRILYDDWNLRKNKFGLIKG